MSTLTPQTPDQALVGAADLDPDLDPVEAGSDPVEAGSDPVEAGSDPVAVE